MTLQLNSFPYFDDFQADKNYNRILFNPTRPVQARELTQIQSMLQNQLKLSSDFTFQNGTCVVPGNVYYDNTTKFVAISTVYNQIDIEQFLPAMVGTSVTGATSGVVASIIWYDIATATTPTTIYVKYTAANGSVNTFLSGEVLNSSYSSVQLQVSAITAFTGSSAICNIGAGIYYVNGFFVSLPAQTITVSQYNNTSSAVIGLSYLESVVTTSSDPTLFDNAAGFNNYGAPGADRLKVTLALTAMPTGYVAPVSGQLNFIPLLNIKSGAVQYLAEPQALSKTNDMIAKRFFDTFGNYVLNRFSFGASNYRNNNRGQWVTNVPYLAGDIVTNAGQNYIAMNQGYSGSNVPVQTVGLQSDGIITWSELPNVTTFYNGGYSSITSTVMADQVAADSLMTISVSPGKAMVSGYEDEYTTQTILTAPKSQSTVQVNQAQIYAPAGTYVQVTGLQGLPNVSSNLTKVTIKNISGTTIGTGWVRSVEYASGSLTTPATVVYNVFLFDITMLSGYNFTQNAYTITSATFAGTIVPTQTPISGSVSSTTTAVTGVGTHFDIDLDVGDLVLIGTTWTSVASIQSPISFTSTNSISASAGTVAFLGSSDLVNVGSYIAPLQQSAIKTMRNSSGSIDMVYEVLKTYTFTTVGTSYAITLTGGETFNPTGHIVVINTGTLGTSIPVNATYVLSGGGTILTISGLTGSTAYETLLSVTRSGALAKQKTKSLVNNTITVINTPDANGNMFTSKNITLPSVDCTNLIKVTESGGTNPAVYQAAGEVDVTKYFTFNTGQWPEYYGLGYLTTTRNNKAPLKITYNYFSHSPGDYFSVDSYSSIPRSLIGTTKIGSNTYYLPDYIDFRSSIDTTGLAFNTASGASISDPIVSTTTLSSSYSYYIPRTDTLGITPQGNIVYNAGTGLNTGMVLATSSVAAFTANPSMDVVFNDDQIMTYKMSDINAMDLRLSDVEYYTALSVNESSAINSAILDQYGNPVTKNGFLIDGFTNFDVSDATNTDYKASIDTNINECTSQLIVNGVNLIEPQGTTDASRTANGYRLTGDIISLPYTEVVLVAQPLASTTVPIQSFSSISYTGQLVITPSSDPYVDNEYNTVVTTSIAAPITNNIGTTVVAPAKVIRKWPPRSILGGRYHRNYK